MRTGRNADDAGDGGAFWDGGGVSDGIDPFGAVAPDLGSLIGQDPDALDLGSLIGREPDVLDRGSLIGQDPDALDRRSLIGQDPDAADRRSLIGQDPDALDRRSLIGADPGAADRRSLVGVDPDAGDRRSLIGVDPGAPDRRSLIGRSPGGPDGADIEADVGSYLDFLSRLCRELGVPDPVEEYFAPVVGRWSDMHAEAERWRTAGARAEDVAESLTKPLGGLDSAWQGADADSFIDYMNRVGLAGHDMSDAMAAMGEVLDATADGIREIVQDMAGVLADAAESGSQSLVVPVQGEERTRQYLDHVNRPTRELFEAVRQILEALVRLCDGIDGSEVFEKITMAHTFPDDNWSFSADTPVVAVPGGSSDSTPAGAPDAVRGGGGGGGGGGPVPATPATPPTAPAPQPGGYVTAGEALPGKAGGMPAGAGAAAAAADSGHRGGMGMMGGMPMMGGMGGQQSGDAEHKSRSRVVGDPEDIFGKPTKASPSVIGEDD
ncbi:WXG100 family type VII secretion target [Actinokineospora iranica]|nr:WXG100 family type VII secretion target [Actinokineospora iranica]